MLKFFIATGSIFILIKKIFIIIFFFLFTQNSIAKTNNYLRDTALTNNQLRLTFKYNIDNVKSLALKSKKNGLVKYIYDVKNGVLPKTKKISHYRYKNVKTFRMGQYNKKCLRIVIESYSKSKKNYSINGKVLTIYLNSSKASSVAKPKKNNSKKKYYKRKVFSKTIIIDAGHGGRDVGASAKGIKEKVITLQIAKKLARKLKKRGYRVFMTRTRDVYMSLKQRSEYANAKKGGMFISIHANAAPVGKRKSKYQGIEVFHLSLKHSKRLKKKRAFYRGKYLYSRSAYTQMTSSWKISKSKKLSRYIKRELLRSVRKHHKVVDKGIRRSGFWVLLASKMPSVLIETGYVTHRKEAKKLKNSHYQNLLVSGIVKGIDAYYRKK